MEPRLTSLLLPCRSGVAEHEEAGRPRLFSAAAPGTHMEPGKLTAPALADGDASSAR